MLMEINVTDEHIVKAEKFLLSEGETFDEERRVFIKNFDTLDLQAVPGSGKTTVLLAKLVILEEFLPVLNNPGVLVISHTNAAIEEIKKRLSLHCPKLFSYPNFVGTIQSFVDTFLCIPGYINKYKKKPYRIDEEIFDEHHYVPSQCRGYINNRTDGEKILKKSRLFSNNELKYGFGITGNFPLSNQNSSTYRGLVNLKGQIRNKGVLCFDDAYIIGDEYLSSFPKVKSLLQKRFRYVFVDEMQDMDRHQYEILENIFFDGGNALCKYQRIGDKNQAIFNGNVHLNNVWSNREITLNLNGSHRLNPFVAELVNSFALERSDGFQVTGLRTGEIKPHLIVFEDFTIEQVIYKFSEIIDDLRNSEKITLNEGSEVKAIGWVKEVQDLNRIGLIDYYSDFNADIHLPKIDFNCLESYLINFDKSKKTLEAVRKNILNALLRILRYEQITDSQHRFFTKRKLLKLFGDEFITEYEELKLNLFQWSFKVIQGKKDEVLDSIKSYIPSFLGIFNKNINHSLDFINGTANTIATQDENQPLASENRVNYHGFDIEITTIHSAKGQTHQATLYLETDFYAECESSRLSSQFKFVCLRGDEGARIKQSSKMCYVGMSRPTDLLCVAVHKSRFDQHLHDIDREKWEVINLE